LLVHSPLVIEECRRARRPHSCTVAVRLPGVCVEGGVPAVNMLFLSQGHTDGADSALVKLR